MKTLALVGAAAGAVAPTGAVRLLRALLKPAFLLAAPAPIVFAPGSAAAVPGIARSAAPRAAAQPTVLDFLLGAASTARGTSTTHRSNP